MFKDETRSELDELDPILADEEAGEEEVDDEDVEEELKEEDSDDDSV